MIYLLDQMGALLNTNLSIVAANYLKQLKIPISKNNFLNDLEENPFYPSLLSLNKTFSKYKVENNSFKLNISDFMELTTPCLAYMRNQDTGNDFVHIIKKDKNKVTYFDSQTKIVSISKFLDDWLNVIFIAQPDQYSGEINYKNEKKKEYILQLKKNALIVVGIIGLLFFSYYFVISSEIMHAAISLLCIYIVGIVISFRLLILNLNSYAINNNNKRTCMFNAKSNCDAVLNSGASQIKGVFWSEIGFFYFLSVIIFLLSPFIPFHQKISYLSVSNILASGFIPYSIFYQYKIIKQWCPLCLLVQFILFMGLIWTIIFFEFVDLVFNISHFTFFICCLLFPLIIWLVVKPILLNSKNARIYFTAYKRLLHSPGIFKELSQNQPIVLPGWEELGIHIGNPNAMNTIVAIWHPYCRYCSKAYSALEGLIGNNEQMRLVLMFKISSEEKQANLVVQFFRTIAKKNDIILTKQVLSDWYVISDRNYSWFAKKYLIEDCFINQVPEKEYAMEKWCNEAKIIHIPTFFINGRKLSDKYDFNDIKTIMDFQ